MNTKLEMVSEIFSGLLVILCFVLGYILGRYHQRYQLYRRYGTATKEDIDKQLVTLEKAKEVLEGKRDAMD